MVLPDKLQTLVLDAVKGELIVNGVSLHEVDEFSLVFNSGEWDLYVRQRKSYSANGKVISCDTAKE